MRPICLSRLLTVLTALCPLILSAHFAFAGSVNIASPRTGSNASGAVVISASAQESTPFHLELWDNGRKLGNVLANSVNTSATLPQGAHTMTILAVSNYGVVLDRNSVTYSVTNPTSQPAPGTLTIASPQPGSTMPGAVSIAAYASESTPFRIEVWDNGHKLGDFFSNAVNTSITLPAGSHTMTVQAVSTSGNILNRSSVTYSVANKTTPGTVSIASPTAGSTSISAVTITASANESTPFFLEIWDNGYKLGDVSASSVNGVYVLPNGAHVLTIQAIDSKSGSILSTSSVNYKVAENCANSRFTQCNLDQMGIDNTQNDCNPKIEALWVANPCGPGVQGVNPVFPLSTLIQGATEGSSPPNQNNLTLNGHSLHLQEVQGSKPSNVLFRAQSPATTGGAIDTHWTLDEYVHLPDPTAHQAFELDAQYTGGGIWTKFYTECAFNIRSGTGFWGVFDSATGGWIFLNGQPQGGQTPPIVPCNRNQFSQPWSGSSNPSFTGWHHIVWNFLRNPDGTVTYQSLTFDSTTTPINFHPNSASGGRVSDFGNFNVLIQLDGVVNTTRQHDIVDAYVSEVNLIHTP